MNQADAEVRKQLEFFIEVVGKEEYSFESVTLYGLLRNVLDLINRLNAENKRLQQNLLEAHLDIAEKQDYINHKMGGAVGLLTEFALEQARAEAIKEMNAKIYCYKTNIFIKGEELIVIPMSDYNDILKEMVGDAE